MNTETRPTAPDPSPRLVQLAEFDRRQAGSFIPLLAGLLARARERGWRTDLVLPETASQWDWAQGLGRHAELHFAPREALRRRFSRRRWLVRELSGFDGPTVLHTHFTSWDLAALGAARALGRETRVFWHVHSALTRNPLILPRSVFKLGVLGRGVAGIICPAPNIALGVTQRLAPPERVHFVPSALDPDLYPLAGPERRARARDELGLPADVPVVLHFGWHTELKGTDIFLRTLRLLVDADPRTIGVVRGHEKAVEPLANGLGLIPNVRFQEPVRDATSLFAAADVVVSSSREEGMAYSVLEALASGTPVVVTAIPGHTYLGEEIAACRISNKEPETLARVTRDVLEAPPQLRDQQAKQAHEWISENLSVSVIAGRMISMYEDSIRGAPSAGGAAQHSSPLAHAATKPRLIQLLRFPNQTPGSFVPMLASAVRTAAARGWTPEVILGSDSAGYEWVESLEAAGARVRFAPDLGLDGLVRWLRSVFAEAGSTVVHTHFTYYDLAAALAARGRANVRLVWHVHSALSPEPLIYARNLVKFRILGSSVDAIICPAPDLTAAVVRRGARPERTHFIPNGVAVERFAPPSPEQRAHVRQKLGIADDAPVILAFNWHWEVKGGELFLDATGAAKARLDGLVALQVTRDARSGETICERGLQGTARTVTPVADARELYAAADVFVASSAREGGTPFAVLEALSSGLGVVASDIPAHRFIAERASGIELVAPTPEGFAAAIVAAIERGAHPVDGPSSVAREFSLDHWSAEVFRVYDAILSGVGPVSSSTSS